MELIPITVLSVIIICVGVAACVRMQSRHFRRWGHYAGRHNVEIHIGHYKRFIEDASHGRDRTQAALGRAQCRLSSIAAREDGGPELSWARARVNFLCDALENPERAIRHKQERIDYLERLLTTPYEELGAE